MMRIISAIPMLHLNAMQLVPSMHVVVRLSPQVDAPGWMVSAVATNFFVLFRPLDYRLQSTMVTVAVALKLATKCPIQQLVLSTPLRKVAMRFPLAVAALLCQEQLQDMCCQVHLS